MCIHEKRELLIWVFHTVYIFRQFNFKLVEIIFKHPLHMKWRTSRGTQDAHNNFQYSSLPYELSSSSLYRLPILYTWRTLKIPSQLSAQKRWSHPPVVLTDTLHVFSTPKGRTSRRTSSLHPWVWGSRITQTFRFVSEKGHGENTWPSWDEVTHLTPDMHILTVAYPPTNLLFQQRSSTP